MQYLFEPVFEQFKLLLLRPVEPMFKQEVRISSYINLPYYMDENPVSTGHQGCLLGLVIVSTGHL
jgi:hypothetical protein